jgi:hypothetical protein
VRLRAVAKSSQIEKAAEEKRLRPWMGIRPPEKDYSDSRVWREDQSASFSE